MRRESAAARSEFDKCGYGRGKAKPVAAALTAIAEADAITLGPGSLFTSVIPNLLVEGIPAAIRRSHAAKAYFVNLMSQPGETTEFSASDHVRSHS